MKWDCLKYLNAKTSGLFAAGVLFGTAGIKILSSKDAKKVYANCTAAVLRAKDCVVKTANVIQENAQDVLEEAKLINEERALEEELMEEFAFEDEEEEQELTEEAEEEKPEETTEE